MPSDKKPATSTSRAPRGKIVAEKGRRLLLFLCIVLAVAGLACDGNSYGITFVGADADGTLIAQGLVHQGGEWDSHKSIDGGLSWTHVATLPVTNHPLWRGDGQSEADTPRGRYQISRDGREITRTVDGRSKTVASWYDFLDLADLAAAHKARISVGNEFHSIHYHAPSGNLIAAMGTEGVIIEQPNGQWSRVAVGRFAPTSFSAAQRAQVLLSLPGPWLSTLAVVAGLAAFAVILVQCRLTDAVLAIGVGAATYTLYHFTNNVTVDSLELTGWVVVAWPFLMAAMYVLLKVSQEGSNKHRMVAMAAVGFVTAGAIFGFPGFMGKSSLSLVWLLPYLFLPMIAAALFLVVVAVRPYLPMGGDWQKAVTAALIAMVLALIGPVLLWLLYALTMEEAKAVSIGLAGMVALVLFGYLKRRQQRRRRLGAWY